VADQTFDVGPIDALDVATAETPEQRAKRHALHRERAHLAARYLHRRQARDLLAPLGLDAQEGAA
jgi:hypothetical protein